MRRASGTFGTIGIAPPPDRIGILCANDTFGVADSPLEAAGFEPSVPEPRNVRSRALSGQTAVTIAGARRLIRSTNSEADRQARPLVINAGGNLR